ncbi:MAG TPA: glycogen/starch synthase, partial [Luteolibacter sp.]
MKIVMFTNTYLPHVGGVARSVKSLEDGCRSLGHEVRVIAPEFEGAVASPDVLRVPAIRNF